MAYENYTIDVFENAWFKKDYSVLSESEFDIVYAEYQDTSGLFLTDDFEKRSYIAHLNQRINYVKIFIRLQREFMKEFGAPFNRDFEMFKHEYGYALKWRNDLDDFEQQLKKVETREGKHISSLEVAMKELNDAKEKSKKNKKQVQEEDSLKTSRLSFIRMRNSLGKVGFQLDKYVTTVEELALMVKQQLEEQEQIQNQLDGR